MTAPCLEEFVLAAQEFCAFAEMDGAADESDLWKIRELLLRLVYHVPSIDQVPHGADFDGRSPDDLLCAKVAQRFSGLSISTYRMVFDPHDFSAADEPVVGLLSDDLSDIYRDLSEGLDNAENGHLPEACFDWSLSYRCIGDATPSPR